MFAKDQAESAETAVSFILLPYTVITQVSSEGGSPITLPKALAVAVRFLVGLDGVAASLFSKGSEQAQNKVLIISCVGILGSYSCWR